MTKLDSIWPATPAGDDVVKADLLLSEPYGEDIDRLSAELLASIGLNGGALKTVVKDKDGRKLVLRTEHGSFSVEKLKTPMGAAAFNKAIPRRLSAAQRSAFMSVISHHEAAITLKIKPNNHLKGNISALLHKAVKTISSHTNPIGLLWGNTGKLHQGDGLRQILAAHMPMELVLRPTLKTTGPKSQKIIHFLGVHELLGFKLNLHLNAQPRQRSIDTGIAFAQSCYGNSGAEFRPSFEHNGKVFRLMRYEGGISLRPVASFNSNALSVLQNKIKTAA